MARPLGQPRRGAGVYASEGHPAVERPLSRGLQRGGALARLRPPMSAGGREGERSYNGADMSESSVVRARDQVLAAVGEVASDRTRPVVVALDGPSGSGKSTLAVAIAAASEAVVVPVDDFFSANIPDAYWDSQPAAQRCRVVFQWERLRSEAIEPLLAGHTARWHAFDFESGTRPDGTYGMRSDWVVREPAPVVLLDGAYSAGPQLADLVDLAVLVDAPEDERRSRLAAREDPDFLAAWHARWDAVEAHYFARVRPRNTFDLVVIMGSAADCDPRPSPA